MSKTITNDDEILSLKQKIADKKSRMTATAFVPKTNCSLAWNGENYNLHTLKKNQVIQLMIELNTYRMSYSHLATTIGADLIDTSYKIGGYDVESWMHDLYSRLQIVCRKDEEARLKVLEDRLHQLLSTDKKVELEINELKGLI